MKKIINKRNVIILTIAIILICFVLPMTITVIAYEANFGSRVTIDKNNSMMKFEDYEMSRENIEFKSNKGQTLRGYLYTKEGVEPKALIVLSHGYLNVHEDYLPQINYFVENGFEVMGYDNTGTNLSDGDNLIGLGQSAIDLDYALRFVESNEDLNKYKVFLYGHSWGGYAVTSVLNYGHNVAGVVARSGYNNSRDMLVEYGSNLYGDWLKLLSPYAYIYEKIKFGDAIDKNGVKGINESKDTPVMLFHSKDDDVISLDNSLLIHKDEFVNPNRIKTVLLEDRGHDVTETLEARQYNQEQEEKFEKLIEEYGGEEKIPQEVEREYFNSIDKQKANEIDLDIMKQIVDFYNEILENR